MRMLFTHPSNFFELRKAKTKDGLARFGPVHSLENGVLSQKRWNANSQEENGGEVFRMILPGNHSIQLRNGPSPPLITSPSEVLSSTLLLLHLSNLTAQAPVAPHQCAQVCD